MSFLKLKRQVRFLFFWGIKGVEVYNCKLNGTVTKTLLAGKKAVSLDKQFNQVQPNWARPILLWSVPYGFIYFSHSVESWYIEEYAVI